MKERTTKREGGRSGREGGRKDRGGGVKTEDGTDHVSPTAGHRTGYVR